MAFDYFYGFKSYVSAAARRSLAAAELAKLQKKGRKISPIAIEGRAIARTFWGKSWCTNLERYSDFASRLPRGRSYVRNGSVVDLQVAPGRVAALVSGSTLYEVNVTVGLVPADRWKAICTDCSGAIDSVIELLQGRLSEGVMSRLCNEETGLFPSPKDILFTCSCPDWASMCKHVAAVLYGIGARLDHQPEMLFTLRQVDQQDLIANAGADLSQARRRPLAAKVLADDDLAGMFGIEMAPEPGPATPVKSSSKPAAAITVPKKKPSKSRNLAASSLQGEVSRPLKPAAASATGYGAKRRLTPAKRRAISERMRKLWAERRAAAKKR